MKLLTAEGKEVRLDKSLRIVLKEGAFHIEPIEPIKIAHPSCGGELCNDGTCHVCASSPATVDDIGESLRITVGDLRRIGLPIFGRIRSNTVIKELRVVPAPTVCNPGKEPEELNARLCLEFFKQPEAINLTITLE